MAEKSHVSHSYAKFTEFTTIPKEDLCLIRTDYQMLIDKKQFQFDASVLQYNSVKQLNKVLPKLSLGEIVWARFSWGEIGDWLHNGLGPYGVTEVMVG